MLYETTTGKPPFLGDDDIAVIGQHINTPPVAPSRHNQQIPKNLDSPIMRLLAKDPTERPGSAEEVLAALEAVDPESATGELDLLVEDLSEDRILGLPRPHEQSPPRCAGCRQSSSLRLPGTWNILLLHICGIRPLRCHTVTKHFHYPLSGGELGPVTQ